MEYSILLSIFLLPYMGCNGQEQVDKFNLGFEETVLNRQLPKDWIKWENSDYDVNVDSSTVYSGKYSIAINITGYS